MSASLIRIPVGYSRSSSSACTFRPVVVLTAPMRLTTAWWLVSGVPRQFMVMWENNRCSILFHLLVPGGRWATVTWRLVAAAKAASSLFQARSRVPLEPPPSAVISSRSAWGEAAAPSWSHQLRSVATANAAVSWSEPTDTQPLFAPVSYTHLRAHETDSYLVCRLLLE